MRLSALLLGAVLLVQSPAAAQQEKSTELGITFVSLDLQKRGSMLTAPGTGVSGMSGFYVSFIPSGSFMITLQPSVAFTTYDGGSSLFFGLGAQAAVLLSSGDGGTPFIGLNIALQSVSGGGYSTSEAGIGGSVGFRQLTGTAFAVRPEVRYMRWLDSKRGTLSLCLSIGGRSTND